MTEAYNFLCRIVQKKTELDIIFHGLLRRRRSSIMLKFVMKRNVSCNLFNFRYLSRLALMDTDSGSTLPKIPVTHQITMHGNKKVNFFQYRYMNHNCFFFSFTASKTSALSHWSHLLWYNVQFDVRFHGDWRNSMLDLLYLTRKPYWVISSVCPHTPPINRNYKV